MNRAEDYGNALRTLAKFRKWVADEATEKVLARQQDLQNPFGGGEEVVERYGHLMLLTNTLMGGIQAVAVEEQRGPPPMTVTGVEEILCPEEEIAERLREWFRGRPGVVPLAVRVLGDADERRVLIVHGSPMAPGG